MAANDALEEGIVFFNAGRYFEAHESWEDVWRGTDGEARFFCQGLVQAAVALHHISRGNLRGGLRVLQRGIDRLRPFRDNYMGVDNASLIEQLERVQAHPGSIGIQIRSSEND